MVRSPAALVGGAERHPHATSASSTTLPLLHVPTQSADPLPFRLTWPTGRQKDSPRISGNLLDGGSINRNVSEYKLFSSRSTEKFDRQSGGLGALTPAVLEFSSGP